MIITIDERAGDGLGVSLGDGKGSYLPLVGKSGNARILKSFEIDKAKLLNIIEELSSNRKG